MTSILQDTENQQASDDCNSEQILEKNFKPASSHTFSNENILTEKSESETKSETKHKKSKKKAKKSSKKSKKKSANNFTSFFKNIFELIFKLIFSDTHKNKSKSKSKRKAKIKAKATSEDASVANASEDAPAANASGDASAANASDGAPAANASDDTSAADTSEDTSAANASDDAPATNASDDAPAANASEDMPAANASEDTPAAKKKHKKKSKKKSKNKKNKFLQYIYQFLSHLFIKGSSKKAKKSKNKSKHKAIDSYSDTPESQLERKAKDKIKNKSSKNKKISKNKKQKKGALSINAIDIIIISITIIVIIISQVDFKSLMPKNMPASSNNAKKYDKFGLHLNSNFDRQLNSEIYDNKASNNKELNNAQDILINYIQSPPKERKKLHKELNNSLNIIEKQIKTCPGHLVFLAQWMRQELGKSNEIDTFSPWQKGCYDYIINDKNLAKDLLECKAMNADERQERINTPLIKISGRLFGEGRGKQLLDIACKAIPEKQLKGKIIADLRGDLGMFAATAVPHVSKKLSSGKVIFIEQNKDYLDFCKHMAKYVPEFSKLDLRLEDDTPNLGLKENEADIACAFDCNYFEYIHYSSKDKKKEDIIQQEKEKRKKICSKIYNGLKSQGVLLIYDYEETAPAEVIMESLKEAGFEVSIKKNKEINNVINRNIYLITAKKP